MFILANKSKSIRVRKKVSEVTIAGLTFSAALSATSSPVFAQAQNPPAGGNGGGFSQSVDTALTKRLPTSAQGNANSVKDIATFLSWGIGFILVCAVLIGVSQGAFSKGWQGAFYAVIGALSLPLLISIVVSATA